MTALGKTATKTHAQSANVVVTIAYRYDGCGKIEEIMRPQRGLFTISTQKSAAIYTGLIREWLTVTIRSATPNAPPCYGRKCITFGPPKPIVKYMNTAKAIHPNKPKVIINLVDANRFSKEATTSISNMKSKQKNKTPQ